MNDNIDKNLNMENLEDSELEQVTGGTNPVVVRDGISLSPMQAVAAPATMFADSVPLTKAYVGQVSKVDELVKTIEASNNVIIYNSSENR